MRKNSDTNKEIFIWLTTQTYIIIAAAFLSFLFVELVAYFIWHDTSNQNFIFHALGTIIPMCVILTVLNYYLFKSVYRYVSTLSNGIDKAANGDFNVRLDPGTAGPLFQVYENFNKMGTELQNVQLLRKDFVDNYSHEFKTPITSINGFATLLLETDVPEENKKQYLKIIVDESARLSELANSTLLLSKLESQQIISDKKPYALDEQLKQCAILLSSQWNKKNISFSCELEPVIYNGEAELMEHLWLNLLNNAVKFTPEQGGISMSLTVNEGGIVIVQISDTGVGMGEEVMSRLFEKYYQGLEVRGSQGLGLGLAIVKRITELCGGTIEVRSTENEGSTFTIMLPNSVS
ncbi:MAG: sensor histidine kinase [Peptococcaceae bacterium]